ncbi:unnamed protein product [Haemonchus placei]|uniref:Uncharacterized protein n=1 Tax=Haemonchus placei TaxID=6290 RepID=A0A0N4WE11_HAEPC|nr:unnamed protein product [Haemonchus placei]
MIERTIADVTGESTKATTLIALHSWACPECVLSCEIGGLEMLVVAVDCVAILATERRATGSAGQAAICSYSLLIG